MKAFCPWAERIVSHRRVAFAMYSARTRSTRSKQHHQIHAKSKAIGTTPEHEFWGPRTSLTPTRMLRLAGFLVIPKTQSHKDPAPGCCCGSVFWPLRWRWHVLQRAMHLRRRLSRWCLSVELPQQLQRQGQVLSRCQWWRALGCSQRLSMGLSFVFQGLLLVLLLFWGFLFLFCLY